MAVTPEENSKKKRLNDNFQTLRIILYPASVFSFLLIALFISALTVFEQSVLLKNLSFALFDLAIALWVPNLMKCFL